MFKAGYVVLKVDLRLWVTWPWPGKRSIELNDFPFFFYGAKQAWVPGSWLTDDGGVFSATTVPEASSTRSCFTTFTSLVPLSLAVCSKLSLLG